MPTDGRFSPSSRTRGLLRAVVAMAMTAGFLVSNPELAEARDSDGTRLGAQEQKIDTEERDALDPPEDSSDWRYVKVERVRNVEFRIDGESGDAELTLRLTEATGDELESVTTSGGTATIEEELSPGVYYFEVKSSETVEYTVALD